MSFYVHTRVEDTVRFIEALMGKLSPAQIDAAVLRTAQRTKAALMRETPVKWTGNTRRAWQITVSSGGGWSVENRTDEMGFLERGTKAHGPVNHASLFIPLTRAAATGNYSGGLVFGKDFLLVQWVRGIKPMRIAEKQYPITLGWLANDLLAFVNATLPT